MCHYFEFDDRDQVYRIYGPAGELVGQTHDQSEAQMTVQRLDAAVRGETVDGDPLDDD